MPEGYAPSLAAGITLLNLFGPNAAAAKTFGVLISALIFAYVLIRSRYPCRSPSTLIKVVDQATVLFDKCLVTRAFDAGEYDRYKLSLQQITARTLGIASRTHYNPNRRSSRHRRYLEKLLFSWRRLKDTVDCHCEAQILVRDLEMCLMRISQSRAEYELQRVFLTRPNLEALRAADYYNNNDVDALV